ncbi:TRAP transporter small permease [Cuneatibacter sp. NSJ-177]|jgi:C4-dicarboxylate transporter DctQ subunit|uniref:TRAP transporter small permease n=1 Tax=Cuneatibacter sp. NSJ-177 TaxID=2931401 RepID=UPI001FD0EBF2|nr:TRAP transporter small permease [Cuneatibacter sp. NSJ-177]MCJ7836898.1 TRAP transporter small permease [Cuneatibacter sp. NSJ-177]
MKKLLRWLDERFEETVLGGFLILITLVIFLQVIMRYVLSHALSWPEEFTRYCLVCSTLLSLSYCIRYRINLRVDILVKYLPETARKVLEFLVQLLSLGLYSYLFYHSFSTVQLSLNSKQVSTAMGFPMYLLYGWGTACFGLAIIRSIQDIIRTFRNKEEKQL